MSLVLVLLVHPAQQIVYRAPPIQSVQPVQLVFGKIVLPVVPVLIRIVRFVQIPQHSLVQSVMIIFIVIMESA